MKGKKRIIVVTGILVVVLVVTGVMAFVVPGNLNEGLQRQVKGCEVQPVTYPESKDVGERDEVDREYLQNLKSFYEKSFCKVLAAEDGENVVYSPVNLYLCMAMLTEMTGGNTQKQLLDALGQDSSEKVREQSRRIWESTYFKNDVSKCVLADSVWLNDKIPFQKSVLESLAKNYYTSTHQGKMGSEEMNQAIQQWVNQMTENQLKQQTEKIETQEDTMLELFSTAYFYDQWETPYSEKNTKKAEFENADGSKSTCDFMEKTMMSCAVYDKEHFTAVDDSFENGNDIHIFLPKEGVSVEKILQEDMADILHISSTYESMEDSDTQWCQTTLLLPKFQADSEQNLIPAMEEMGVTDLFQANQADFTPLLGKEEEKYMPYVDKVQQSSKIAVDENGCSVASYTQVEMKCGAAMAEKEITINCNRPFLFVISNPYGVPIFAGVVNVTVRT